jgi:hypothetical protein
MSEDYEVGYKKPPKASQFKKGKSGNPKGRPKHRLRPAATLLLEELAKSIEIIEKGVRRTVTKQEALMMAVVNQSIKGDPPARRYVLEELKHHRIRDEEEGVEVYTWRVTREDRAKIDSFLEDAATYANELAKDPRPGGGS